MILTSIKEHSKNALWLFFKNGSIAISSLLVAYVAANYLQPETFGTYKYLISFVAFLGIFSLIGAPSSLVRHVAKTGENPIRFLSKKNMYIGSGVSIMLLVVSVYYFYMGNGIFALAFLVAAITLPVQKYTGLAMNFLNGLQKYKLLSILSSLSAAVVAVCVITAMLLTGDVLTIFLTFTIATTGTSALMYVYLAKKYRFPKSTPIDTETYAYAKQLSFMYVIKKIANQIDTILAFQFLGPATVAAYALAKTPVEQIRGKSSIIRTLALPRFSRYSQDTIRHTLHKKALLFFVAMLVIVVTYILLAPTLYEVLLPKYVAYVSYSQILALSLLAAPSILYLEALTAAKRTKHLYIVESVVPFIKLIILVLCTYLYGIYGLLFAFVFSHFLLSTVCIGLYYKKNN